LSRRAKAALCQTLTLRRGGQEIGRLALRSLASALFLLPLWEKVPR